MWINPQFLTDLFKFANETVKKTSFSCAVKGPWISLVDWFPRKVNQINRALKSNNLPNSLPVPINSKSLVHNFSSQV